MKKLTLLFAALMVSVTVFAQTCVDDAWQCLRQNQAPKAKKFIEECLAANPDNAQVWLMRGNVYINLYNTDQKKLKADPNYTPRYPDALQIANESFVKALSLDPKVQPKSGMLGAIDGQKLCAEPFYDLGNSYLKKGDYQKALDNFLVAAKNYELAKSSNASLAYYSAAAIYKENLKDNDNAKKMFAKSVSANPNFIYGIIELYYMYVDDKDTVNCGKMIDKMLAVPAEKLLKDVKSGVYEAQMSYYSMLNDEAKLMATCDSALAFDSSEEMVARCANYLSNYKAFQKAEDIIKNALAANPGSYKLNEQMGYLFYERMHAIEDQVAALQKEKKWNEAIALKGSPELKEMTEKAHEWCQKAYNIDADHLDNNKRLRELKVKLQLEVPQELNDKINARMHQN